MHSYLEKNIINCPRCGAKFSQAEDSAACGKCGFVYYLNPAPCTTLLIFENDKLLMAKRAISPQKGYWDLPGGFVDLNESLEEGAIRETKEETGLRVEVEKYLGSFADVYGDTGIPTLNFFIKMAVIGGEPHAQDDVSALKWFDLNNLPQEFAFKNVEVGIDLLKRHLESQTNKQ